VTFLFESVFFPIEITDICIQALLFVIKATDREVENSICGGHCGGTIISKNQILSAAHCFHDPVNVTNIMVYIGSPKYRYGTQYNVSDVKIHESYDNVTNINDIAILTLKEDIKMGKDVAPACFPKSPISTYFGKTLIVSGWGEMRNLEDVEDLQVLKNLVIQAECPQPQIR